MLFFRILLVLFFLGVLPVFAQARDVFLAEDIAVDVTAESATAARDKAVLDGERQAFALIMQRILPEGTAPLDLDASAVHELVQSMEINDELITGKRYRARLTLRLDGEAIQALLTAQGVTMEIHKTARIVVVPILEESTGPRVWGEQPWMEAWKALPHTNAELEWVLPQGDLSDMNAISAELFSKSKLASYEQPQLARWMKHYDADAVVTARLQPMSDSQTQAVATLILFSGNPPRVMMSEVSAEKNIAKLSAQMASRLAASLPEQWARYSSGGEHFGLVRLRVIAPISQLEDWVSMRKILTDVSAISSITLRRVAPHWVDMEWTSSQNEAAIITALAARGLRLTQEAEGWRVGRD